VVKNIRFDFCQCRPYDARAFGDACQAIPAVKRFVPNAIKRTDDRRSFLPTESKRRAAHVAGAPFFISPFRSSLPLLASLIIIAFVVVVERAPFTDSSFHPSHFKKWQTRERLDS